MKRLFSLLIASSLLIYSCQMYDDTQIKTDITSLQLRVTALETLCGNMNSDIVSLKSTISALQNNNNVKEVQTEADGYRIFFTNGQSIFIRNGKDGINGKDGADGKDGVTPIIGVKKHTDGQYYWTLNGTWLLDNIGNKIRVTGDNGADGTNGKNGITPKLRIDNGYWFISYDNESTWTNLGKASGEDGDSFFSSVKEDDSFVYLNFTDGTVIKLVKAQPLSLIFERTSFHPSSTEFSVPFTVNGAGDDLKVFTFCEGSLTAQATVSNGSNGTIKIKFLSADCAGNVLVAAKSNGGTVMDVLEFEKGQLTTSTSDNFTIGYNGGDISISISRNMEISINTDVDWIANIKTKSLTNENLSFRVSENSGLNARTGTITIKSKEDNTALTFTVTQRAKDILTIDETSKVMQAGDTYTIKIRTNLTGALTWKSSNPSVASVNSDGVVTALAKGETVITVSGNDGELTASCVITVKSFTGTIAGHTYVDLGLPSRKLWSTTNVGAYSDTQAGTYYMWSNISTVQSLWGSLWSAPTSSEFSELMNYCTYEWTTKNGTNGYLFTGPNGATMFMPAAGWKIYVDGYGFSGVQGNGSNFMYWSSTKSSYSWEGQTFAFTLSGSSSSLSGNETYNTSMTAAPIRPISR